MTTTCPNCPAEVLEAKDPLGAILRLNALPARKGKYAAKEDNGVLRVRLITETRPLAAGETRYSKHTCRSGGVGAWREAQAKAAAAGRRRQHRPVRRGLFDGVSGVRAARREGKR